MGLGEPLRFTEKHGGLWKTNRAPAEPPPAYAYIESPRGGYMRWAAVDISRRLRNAKTRLGELHFRDLESVSVLTPPVFGETSASRVRGCVDTPPSSSSRLSTSRSNERGSGAFRTAITTRCCSSRSCTPLATTTRLDRAAGDEVPLGADFKFQEAMRMSRFQSSSGCELGARYRAERGVGPAGDCSTTTTWFGR
jgi:hypothetical protein